MTTPGINPDVFKKLAFKPEFLHVYGAFYSMWASIELVSCFGIGKLLKISHEQANILTSGMEFGRKAILLRNLAHKSNHKNKDTIIGSTAWLQNKAMRNIFAHGFIISSEDKVTFIERSRGGDYTVTTHGFTLDEFVAHVTEVSAKGADLENALEVTPADHRAFANAAVNAAKKSATSPEPPSETT